MRGRRCARRVSPDVGIVYVDDWYTHPGFIEASAMETERALARLVSPVREQATLVFTAHSIPASMAARYPYQQQYEETARLIAERCARAAGWRCPT